MNKKEVPLEYNFYAKFSQCIKPIVSQGLNSTVYALIANSMISDRMCKLNKKKVNLSITYLTSCNSGSNSSQGSVVAIVKFISSVDVPLDKCILNPSNVCDFECNRTFSGKTIKGLCKVSGEDNIKREILKNGPIAISIKMKNDFTTYRQGIYQYRPGAGVFNITNEHIVKVIGWGEIDGVKYWQIENTWGDDWGESGYGKIEINATHGIVDDNALAIQF